LNEIKRTVGAFAQLALPANPRRGLLGKGNSLLCFKHLE